MADAILVKTSYNESNTKTLLFSNKVVQLSTWVDDETYTDYPYKADITCDGMTANHTPEIVFSLTDATSGDFAPVCNSGTNKVTIWAKRYPDGDITIPTITATLIVT